MCCLQAHKAGILDWVANDKKCNHVIQWTKLQLEEGSVAYSGERGVYMGRAQGGVRGAAPRPNAARPSASRRARENEEETDGERFRPCVVRPGQVGTSVAVAAAAAVSLDL